MNNYFFPCNVSENDFKKFVNDWMLNELDIQDVEIPEDSFEYSFENKKVVKEEFVKNKKQKAKILEQLFSFTYYSLKKEEKFGFKMSCQCDNTSEIFECVIANNKMFVKKDVSNIFVSTKSCISILDDSSFVRDFIWNGFGGYDVFQVNGQVHFIGLNDLDKLNEINNVKDRLPIVYITPLDRGYYFLNCERLAVELIGKAHVVCEASPVITKRFENKRPFNIEKASASILYSDMIPKVFGKNGLKISSEDLSNNIIENVNNASQYISEDYHFNNLKFLHLLKNTKNNELTDVFEKIISDKEEEIKNKDLEIEDRNKEIEKLKADIYKLKSESVNMRDNFEKLKRKSSDADIELYCDTESELYNGEFLDVILAVCKNAYNLMDENKQNTSRLGHVLSDIIDTNDSSSNFKENVISGLKSILKDGITSDNIAELEKFGFNVQKSGGHYKVYLKGDSRYFVTISSTPSDTRMVQNTINTFINTFFS